MAKVTYLFGAGASCECLPLVKNIPKRLEPLKILIAGYIPPDINAPIEKGGQIKAEIKNEIIVALENLITKVKLHASIDTYAK